MANDTQSSQLQQSNSNLATGNPQPLVPSGLQNQSNTSLQPAGSQTFAGLSLLDQGSTAISLSSVTKTGSSSAQATPTKTPNHAKTILIGGGAVVLVLAILVGIVYGLLRQR